MDPCRGQAQLGYGCSGGLRAEPVFPAHSVRDTAPRKTCGLSPGSPRTPWNRTARLRNTDPESQDKPDLSIQSSTELTSHLAKSYAQMLNVGQDHHRQGPSVAHQCRNRVLREKSRWSGRSRAQGGDGVCGVPQGGSRVPRNDAQEPPGTPWQPKAQIQAARAPLRLTPTWMWYQK